MIGVGILLIIVGVLNVAIGIVALRDIAASSRADDPRSCACEHPPYVVNVARRLSSDEVDALSAQIADLPPGRPLVLTDGEATVTMLECPWCREAARLLDERETDASDEPTIYDQFRLRRSERVLSRDGVEDLAAQWKAQHGGE